MDEILDITVRFKEITEKILMSETIGYFQDSTQHSTSTF